LRELGRSICASLDVIGKSAEDFLESKRTQFGRFYFISNDELIEMLASHKNPKNINPFIRNLFEADSLIFDDTDSSLVTGMKTNDGTELLFEEKVNTKTTEALSWMCSVEAEMQKAVY
jgi:dynein heavy chain